MKEYGGFISIEKSVCNEYYSNCHCFNAANNALLCLLKSIKAKKVYIPYFLCDSVEEKLSNNDIAYQKYHIDENMLPIFSNKLKRNEYIYIVNYYGQFSVNKLLKLKSIYKNIIVDNVQSFFQKPIEGIYTIYSCRKYFGVPDGAYLYAKDVKIRNLEIDNSSERYAHIIGRCDDNAENYYKHYRENEERLENVECKLMSKSTHIMLSNIDYKYVISKRNSNYSTLDIELKKYNLLKLRKQKGPYCYPLFVKNGEAIRKELIKNKIYVPILWPNVLELDDCIEKDYAANILPIPCDQRYDSKDMKYIANIVIKLIKKYNK